MLIYLLKSTFCLGLLLLIYQIIFENVKMHRFNRGFLLFGLAISFLIPLCPTGITLFPLDSVSESVIQVSKVDQYAIEQEIFTEGVSQFSWVGLVGILYGLGLFAFLFRFDRNLYNLILKTKTNPNEKFKRSHLVMMEEEVLPYTFLNKIFVNEKDYRDGKIDDQLLTHEYTHASQRHSWDIIFIELLICIFWFNPILYLYKRAIQLNHEFLADESVIRQYQTVKDYQYLLLETIKNNKQIYLASNINFQLTKKRLDMMTKKSTARRKSLLIFSSIPLILFVLVVFGRPVLAQSVKSENTQTTDAQKKDAYFEGAFIHYKSEKGVMVKSYNSLPDHVKEMLPPLPPMPPNPNGSLSNKKVDPLPQGTIVHLNENGSIFIDGNHEMRAPLPPRPPGFPKAVKAPKAPKAAKAPKDAKTPKLSKTPKAPKSSVKATTVRGALPLAPPVPPIPPVPPSLEELLDIEDAIFILDGKEVSAETIREIISKDKFTINHLKVRYNDGRSKVTFNRHSNRN